MHVKPELRDPAMILAFEGWNDAGEAASLALRFLNNAIHSVPLAEIDPEDFYDFTVCRPGILQLDSNVRCIEWPVNEFRYGSVGCSRELIVGTGVEPHLHWRAYCDAIVGLAHEMDVRCVVLAGAYLAAVVYSQPVTLTGFASNSEALAALGVTSSGYEGPTGIVGVLADRLQREGIDVLSLWAGLPHYIDAAPNPRGALALLQKITQYLDFRIDEAPLRSRAAEFEQEVSKMVSSDSELADYVKRLKRREFAQ